MDSYTKSKLCLTLINVYIKNLFSVPIYSVLDRIYSICTLLSAPMQVRHQNGFEKIRVYLLLLSNLLNFHNARLNLAHTSQTKMVASQQDGIIKQYFVVFFFFVSLITIISCWVIIRRNSELLDFIRENSESIYNRKYKQPYFTSKRKRYYKIFDWKKKDFKCILMHSIRIHTSKYKFWNAVALLESCELWGPVNFSYGNRLNDNNFNRVFYTLHVYKP